MEEKILQADYAEVMQKSYIDYAMSVITARALPDVRDGLKPVQRRVLFDMHGLGIRYDKPYRKCARIVGDTMGKYHPHGDSSIYDALVVMSQDFKKGMILVDGHGNFGSIEGDGAAAMRYTEARLQKFTQLAFLADLDKNTVNFIPNFDETEKEPSVLPAKVPNLLINGADGIAVGMATSIPPHNLVELLEAEKALIRKKTLSDEDLMAYIHGPDFPTGGMIVNKDDLPGIYASGQGKLRIRGRVVVEEDKNGKQRLVITEIPYTMVGANIGKFLSDVTSLIENKETIDVTDISNQSSKEGIRIVLELRKEADACRLENLLYKKTRLEDTFGVNMLAIVDGKPETLSLKKALKCHIQFLFEINTRKYQTLLAKEEKKKEIQEGLIRACGIIDLIIEILRGSKGRDQAWNCLTAGKTDGIRFKTVRSQKAAGKLNFTAAQADAILDMRLYRLIGLEEEALLKDHVETLKNIAKYQDILKNPKSMSAAIIKELDALEKEFGRPRKTEVIQAGEVILEKIEPEAFPITFLMDRFGYVRSVEESVYQRNREAADAENRFVIQTISTGKVCIFTDAGKAHVLKLSDVPYGKFRDKGKPLDNLCGYDSSQESPVCVLPLDCMENTELMFATKMGMVKRTDGTEFSSITKKTVAATKLQDGDKVLDVHLVTEGAHLVLATKAGFFLRLQAAAIPIQKKNALGVRGIRLSENDFVSAVYWIEGGLVPEVNLGTRKLKLNNLRIGNRDTKGTKQK